VQATPDHSAPSYEALEAASNAAGRAGGSAAVRWGFIARALPDDPPPPMARMLRGGRGGEVRLKLYLSFLWFARNSGKGPRLAYPAQSWAQLLDLGDSGARRVQDALRWLQRENFIRLEHRPGEASATHLLDDLGTGKKYESAGQAANRYRNDPLELPKHYYVQLDSKLWTRGWICVLSGPAIAMYLAVLHALRGDDGPAWFSPDIARSRYDLSEDTRSRGLRELTRAGLITTARRPVGTGAFDDPRYRNIYTHNKAKLADIASVPPPPPRVTTDTPAFT
jgi:DNA-binding transcriptional ArsR family regulator